jgi:xylose isomerase
MSLCMKSAILLQERSFKTKLSRKYMDYNDKVGKQLMTLYEVQAYLPLEPVNTMYTASKLEVICS